MIERYTSGNYEDLLEGLLEGASMEEYLAKKLHEAMDGVGTDEDAVLETLISSTNEEIAAIKRYFYRGNHVRGYLSRADQRKVLLLEMCELLADLQV